MFVRQGAVQAQLSWASGLRAGYYAKNLAAIAKLAELADPGPRRGSPQNEVKALLI